MERGGWYMHSDRMSDDVYKYIQKNIGWNKLNEKHLESNGFFRCIDYPQV